MNFSIINQVAIYHLNKLTMNIKIKINGCKSFDSIKIDLYAGLMQRVQYEAAAVCQDLKMSR